MQEALSLARAELGEEAVVLNTRYVKAGGVLGIGGATRVELTAAVDDAAPSRPPIGKGGQRGVTEPVAAMPAPAVAKAYATTASAMATAVAEPDAEINQIKSDLRNLEAVVQRLLTRNPSSAGQARGEGAPYLAPSPGGEGWGEGAPYLAPSPGGEGWGEGAPYLAPSTGGEGWGEGAPYLAPSPGGQARGEGAPYLAPSPGGEGWGEGAPYLAPSPGGEGWGEGAPYLAPSPAGQARGEGAPYLAPSPGGEGWGEGAPLLVQLGLDEDLARGVLAGLVALEDPIELESALAAKMQAYAAPPVLDGHNIIAVVGPTGVGKTTTLAKLAARFALEEGKKVALVTADTYRIGAVEQLRTYARIMGVPLEIALSPDEVTAAVAKHHDKDVVLVDTVGRSQRSDEHLAELKTFVEAANPTDVYLCVAASLGRGVQREVIERFAALSPTRLVVTKLDESANCGALVNLPLRTGLGIACMTAGQNVPQDIEFADAGVVARMVVGVAQ